MAKEDVSKCGTVTALRNVDHTVTSRGDSENQATISLCSITISNDVLLS